MGFLFESLVLRDLRVHAQPLDGRLFHYRDNNGLEADAIIELPDGRWAAFEIKLGAHPAVSSTRPRPTSSSSRLSWSAVNPSPWA